MSFEPVDSRIEEYQMKLAKVYDDPVLLAMEVRAREKGFPIVGRLVGLFLQLLVKSIGARRIFEFGSGFGYSAYWFAQSAGKGGKVICTDADIANIKQAKQFLTKAGLWERIDFKLGMAQDHFQKLKGNFDICYNDVDKGEYPEVWAMAKERIRAGGFYIADNVLWHGRVALKDSEEDVVQGWTKAIKKHNKLIFNDPDFDAFINPTRDGVIVARRK